MPRYVLSKGYPVEIVVEEAADEEAALEITEDIWATAWYAIEAAIKGVNDGIEGFTVPPSLRTGNVSIRVPFAYDGVDVTEVDVDGVEVMDA